MVTDRVCWPNLLQRTRARSGTARNFRQGVAFLPIHRCSAALPTRPYNKKRHNMNRLYEQLHVTGH